MRLAHLGMMAGHARDSGCESNVLQGATPLINKAALWPGGARGGDPRATLTCEAGQHCRRYDWFALLHRVAPFLDVVLEGHGRLAEAHGLAAVILEALEGRHPLHVQQGRLAVPGLQQGVRALEAVPATLGGVAVLGLSWQRQPGTDADSSGPGDCLVLSPAARDLRLVWSFAQHGRRPAPPQACRCSIADCWQSSHRGAQS